MYSAGCAGAFDLFLVVPAWTRRSQDFHADLLLSELPCLANGRNVDIDRVSFYFSSTVDHRVLAGVGPSTADADLRAERQNIRVGSHGSLARFRAGGGFSFDRVR